MSVLLPWFYGLIRRTAANRPHRNFTSPHTDGPSPLPATLLTLGLWLDGSIIIPVYASSPHKLPCSFCGLSGDRSFPLGSRGAPAVRLGIDRKYPICPMLRGVLPHFLFQRAKAFVSLQKLTGNRWAFIGRQQHEKPASGKWKGDTFPYGQGLGYLKSKNFFNELDF